MKLLLNKKGTKWENKYYEMEDCVLLKLINKNECYNCYIDKQDYSIVSKGIWHVTNIRKNSHLKNIYSIIWSTILNNKKVNYEIYQLILGTKLNNKIVDHIDNDRFNNRRSNLRITTNRINAINQYHKGYYYDKDSGKFLARISVNIDGKSKTINIGRYKTEQECEEIYLKASIIIGNDNISTYIKNRIKELNIVLTEEDLNNKYIKKIKCILERKEIPHNLNGRKNNKYDDNIDIIIKLRDELNYSWKAITRYLRENNIVPTAKSETVKNRYKQKRIYRRR